MNISSTSGSSAAPEAQETEAQIRTQAEAAKGGSQQTRAAKLQKRSPLLGASEYMETWKRCDAG